MGKRIFDLLLISIAGLIFLPVSIILGMLIYLTIGHPAIFSQQRPGLMSRPFYIYKFRTMSAEKNSRGELLSDAERLTNFGRWLRSTSLDELPSLWNVLKGDMSVVGPRPLLMEYILLYNSEQARRHEVKPGITGWAQVNGRNAISWEEKFKFDVWYVDNRSFWLDVKVVILTIKKVFYRDGISAKGEATMPKFTGNSKKIMQNYIYGAGGHGKVVLDAMQAANVSCVGFIDDKDISTWVGLSIYQVSELNLETGNCIHLAVGDCKTREALVVRLSKVSYFSVIHPSSVISKTAQVGLGTFCAAQSIIGPDAMIGSHCIINHAAVVDHDCTVGDYTHIAPQSSLGGGVRIGRGVLIGAGAVVLPGIKIADYAVVGAGAIVTKDVAAGMTVVGNPAKSINN